MIEVNVIDGASGEAEIMQLLTAYLSDRLFTPRQRKSMQVFVDLTRAPLRVPVTRAMLMPRRSGLRTIAPGSFEMTVSTAAGIRDAGEVLAHEMIHISQVMNGRLVFNRGIKKVNGSKAKVDLARWMGGKPVIIDQLEWRHRPWEIEACHWQTILVDEFLTLAGGNQPVQQLNGPGKKHIALFEAALLVPRVAQSNPELHLDMMDVPEAMSPETTANKSETAAQAFGNQANAQQARAQSAIDDIDENTISAVGLEAVFDAVETQADYSPEDMVLCASGHAAPINMDTSQLDGTAEHGLHLNGSDLNGAQMNGSCLNDIPANGLGTNVYHPDTAIPASDDVIQIIVPGLEFPRPLNLDSLVAKRRDLEQRGLLKG